MKIVKKSTRFIMTAICIASLYLLKYNIYKQRYYHTRKTFLSVIQEICYHKNTQNVIKK